MARVNEGISVVGFAVASTLGLYMLWKIPAHTRVFVGERSWSSKCGSST
jgi:hypothetical protein